MLGTWLTTRAVYVFGAVLILIGLMFIITGVPVVRLEIGQAEIVGGSVAAAAGCVVLVLGLVLARFEVLQQTLDRLTVAARPAVAAPEPEPVEVAEPAQPQPAPAPRAMPVHPLAPAAKRARRPLADVRPEPALHAAVHDVEEQEPPAVDPLAAPVLTESAPALLHAEEEASHSPLVAPVVAQESTRQRSSFLSSILPRRTPPTMPWRAPEPPPPGPAPWRDLDPVPASSPEDVYAPLPERDPTPPPLRRTVADLASEWDAEEGAMEAVVPAVPQPPVASPRQSDLPYAEPAYVEPPHDEPAPAMAAERDAVHEGAASHDGGAAGLDEAADDPVRSADIHTLVPKGDASVQPVVVGRYNAGAASYVMYSNGMIEVETEQGTHQFASMQELKAFIERRDTAARA